MKQAWNPLRTKIKFNLHLFTRLKSIYYIHIIPHFTNFVNVNVKKSIDKCKKRL